MPWAQEIQEDRPIEKHEPFAEPVHPQDLKRQRSPNDTPKRPYLGNPDSVFAVGGDYKDPNSPEEEAELYSLDKPIQTRQSK